jgi:hypothetical protein
MLKEYPNHTPALAETVGVTALARPAKKAAKAPSRRGQCPEQCALGRTLRRSIRRLFGLQLCLGYSLFVLLLVLIHLSLCLVLRYILGLG